MPKDTKKPTATPEGEFVDTTRLNWFEEKKDKEKQEMSTNEGPSISEILTVIQSLNKNQRNNKRQKDQ